MDTKRSGPVVLMAVVALLLAGCSDVPDMAELSASLLVPEDLAAPFDEWKTVEPGILAAPSVYLCEAADNQSRTALDDLEWEASTALSWAYVLVQEAVLAGEPADVESTFEALRQGLTACTGSPATGEGGRPFTSQLVEVDDTGDESVGTRDVYEDGTIFTNVLVRDGSVLMLVVTGENPVSGDASIDDEEVSTIAAAAVDNLP